MPIHATRPRTINEVTWGFLMRGLRKIPQTNRLEVVERLNYPCHGALNASSMLPIIAERPNAFLVELGVFDQPDVLLNTVIETADGVELLMMVRTIRDLERNQPLITLERIYDHTPVEMDRETLIATFAASQAFDQLERPDPFRYTIDQLQKVVDRHGKGSITQVEAHWPNAIVTATSGRFVLTEEESALGKDAEAEALKKLRAIFGKIIRLDYVAQRGIWAHSVHQNDRYYYLYRFAK